MSNRMQNVRPYIPVSWDLAFGTWPLGLRLQVLAPALVSRPPGSGLLALACWFWPLGPGFSLQALGSPSGPLPWPPGWRLDVGMYRQTKYPVHSIGQPPSGAAAQKNNL